MYIDGEPGQCLGTPGAVYVRWGRTTCPATSELAYAGKEAACDASRVIALLYALMMTIETTQWPFWLCNLSILVH